MAAGECRGPFVGDGHEEPMADHSHFQPAPKLLRATCHTPELQLLQVHRVPLANMLKKGHQLLGGGEMEAAHKEHTEEMSKERLLATWLKARSWKEVLHAERDMRVHTL